MAAVVKGKLANSETAIGWSIEYYSEVVEEWVMDMPAGIRAKYFAIANRMKVHGPNLGMPYTKPMGVGERLEMSEPAKKVETSKRRRTHDLMFAEFMKDPASRKAYEEAEQDLSFFDECVKARKHAGLTQGEVAKHMGTSIAAISRIETAGDRNAKPSPSVATLQRYAAAVGCRLVLKLEPALRQTDDGL